jgi:hypothetical protein
LALRNGPNRDERIFGVMQPLGTLRKAEWHARSNSDPSISVKFPNRLR